MEEEKKLSVYKIHFITENWNYYKIQAKFENIEEALQKWRNMTRIHERINCEAPNWTKACIKSSKVSEITAFFER